MCDLRNKGRQRRGKIRGGGEREKERKRERKRERERVIERNSEGERVEGNKTRTCVCM